MCGIFGYIGKKNNAAEVVLEGLKRLDYRGYDSWGVGVLANSKIIIEKKAGKVNNIKLKLPASSTAIGHTRWATHGKVNDINAHPHYSQDKSFIVVQNGIVENYLELKNSLQKKGYPFITETDTEVIVRLIEDNYKKTSRLENAIQSAFKKLEGRNTIIVLDQNGNIIAARNGSPLVIGINKTKEEIYFSSDTLSFAQNAKQIIVLNNGEMAVADSQSIKIVNINSGKRLIPHIENIEIAESQIDKAGYKHFMLKEIHENPQVIAKILAMDHQKLLELAKAISRAQTVYTIGSGTAGAAAAQIAYYLRKYSKIPAVALIGAEAEEYYNLFTNKDLIIAPSQSGETADVLEVLEIAQKKGTKIASLVNMPGSMMTRISNYKFMSEAGPEICVMSTKIFVSQIAWGYLVAKTIQNRYSEGIKNLNATKGIIQEYLNSKINHKKLISLAKKLIIYKDIFLLSKSQNLQIIKEAMVKMIEGSYIHAHAIPAGDLKHYAITLMEKDVPVIALLSDDSVKKDIMNAVSEVKARNATIIGISPFLQKQFDFHLQVPDTGETSAITNIIPLQLLAYYMADELGTNVDKPRNIAKSVTVK